MKITRVTAGDILQYDGRESKFRKRKKLEKKKGGEGVELELNDRIRFYTDSGSYIELSVRSDGWIALNGSTGSLTVRPEASNALAIKMVR